MEELESRVTPALPLNQNPLQVLGTYAQYQDVVVRGTGFDNSIHLHEGVDLAAAAGTPVRSVLAGRVDAIWNDLLSPKDSFVVIRDTGAGNALLATGFNYKHTIPLAGLAVGALVAEGAQIGTVARFGGGLPDHLHVDRGNNGATFPAAGNVVVARDPTIAGLLPGLNREITRVQAQRDAVQREVDDLNARLTRIPPANVMLRATVTAALRDATIRRDARQAELAIRLPFRDALQWQFPTVLNPMEVLAQDPTVVDNIVPTINALDFRLGVDDVLGNRRALGGTLFNQQAEQPRTGSRYFTSAVNIGGQAHIRLGRLAGVASRDLAAAPTAVQRGDIDFVVDARDNFGPAGQAQQRPLSPTRFDLTISGAAFGATSGLQQSFDFRAFPTYRGLGDFSNVANTRVAFENDNSPSRQLNAANHNSGIFGPFFYNLTNSTNLNGGQQRQGGMQPADSALFWNSDAAQGKSLISTAAQDGANDATRNADATFPDDVHTIRVGATDFAANRTTRDFRVVLTNWARTVQTNAAAFNAGDTISVTGGVQYRANQTVELHLVPAVGTVAAPPAGTALNDGTLEATVTTDANGELPAATFIHEAAPGRFFVIADYNGDREFTPLLDAFTVVTVKGTSQTTLNANPNPSTVGQNVTLTATISSPTPEAGIPTGSVTFFNGQTNLGTKALVNGTATLAVNTLPAGNLQLRAEYNGSPLFAPSSNTANQTVNPPAPGKMDPQASLAPNGGPHVFGQAVTLTATVSADIGSPTGSVFFFDGDTPLGSATLSGGTASLIVSNLSPGTHNFAADYSGDDAFNFVSTSASDIINRGDTAVSVTATSSSVPVGEDIELTVVVSAVSPSAGTPTGQVDLFEGATYLGSAETENGAAVFTLSNFSPGDHTFTANYAGDVNFNASTGSTSATVLRLDTVTFGSTTPYPQDPAAGSLGDDDGDEPVTITSTFVGEQIAVTAVVAGTDESVASPGGTVAFYNGASLLGTGTVVDGQATLVIDGLSAGSYTFTLCYSGDANFNASTTTVDHIVVTSETSLDLSTSPNPSALGQAVTLTATVAPVAPAAGTPTGTVEFYDGDTLLGTATLSGGTAALVVSNLGSHERDVWAMYLGDGNFELSLDSESHTVLNAAPVANADSAVAGIETPVQIQVLGNDSDADNDPLTITGVSTPTHGAAVINADNTITYTPNATLLTTDTFTYTLADGYGGTATGTVTVTLDPTLVGISVSDVSHSEGNSGTTAFTFTVSLSSPSLSNISVAYSTAHGTTNNSDLTLASGTLTFSPGETTRSVTINVNGDNDYEVNEDFFVNLSNAIHAQIQDGQGRGTVVNDDAQPGLAINDTTGLEGNSGTTAFTFTLYLTAASYQTITVNYTTANGTATTTDNDYVSASGTVTFAPGETSKTITVLVRGDTKPEANEDYFVNLMNAINAVLLDGQGKGTILNDD